MKAHLETGEENYKQVREAILSELRGLGLSSYAARAFLAVVEAQPVSATNICEKTGIPDSKIYYALRELEDKRLVMAQHGTHTLYRVVSGRKILSGLESELESRYRSKIESLTKLEKSLEPLIEKDSSSSQDVELAYIIKGFKNILGKMKESIAEARKEIVFMSCNEELVAKLEEQLLSAKSRKVSVKLALADNVTESKEEFKTHLRPNRSLLCKCNLLIVDSEKLINAELDDSEHQYAIVTRNQSMIMLTLKSYDNPSCCC